MWGTLQGQIVTTSDPGPHEQQPPVYPYPAFPYPGGPDRAAGGWITERPEAPRQAPHGTGARGQGSGGGRPQRGPQPEPPWTDQPGAVSVPRRARAQDVDEDDDEDEEMEDGKHSLLSKPLTHT